MIGKKEKNTPSLLIFDPPRFKICTLFEILIIHQSITTLKPVKKAVPTILTQNPHHGTGIVIRLEKIHNWPKFVNSVSPAFS